MKITSKAVFWLALLATLASWELLLWRPSQLWYWLVLNLAASAALSNFLAAGELPNKPPLGDRLALIIFNASVFYWLLWLDFGLVKYFIPWLLWLVLLYLLVAGSRQNRSSALLTVRLVFFLGGTFFSASIAFGLVTVLGWPLWLVLLIFLAAFAALAGSGIFYWAGPPRHLLIAYLALTLLAAEALAVLSWLPFTEVTLGLVLTIIILASYDLLKYFVQPELIVRRIIVKKIAVYGFFLVLVLVSTAWL